MHVVALEHLASALITHGEQVRKGPMLLMIQLLRQSPINFFSTHALWISARLPD